MKVLVTGGAGFVGCNTVARLIRDGHEVFVYDDLSRKGTPSNVEWLKTVGKFTLLQKDVRNYEDLLAFFNAHKDLDAVFHFAAQVAVTTSVTDPRNDFEINVLGTFNLLEAVRNSGARPFVLYTSTNKVYGKMADIPVVEREGRYQYESVPEGIPESRLLDFYSPYGCSKGTADQYMRDYSRIYGLDACVFRMSCIYGPRQFGVEDQGWVAWFIIATILDRPITIYGDGKQVRDILYVEDLVNAYMLAWKNREKTSGQIYNIGGGPQNQLSLLELLAILEEKHGRKIPVSFDDWRAGDQPIYVSNIGRIGSELGWTPAVDSREGIDRLFDWVDSNKGIFDL